MRATFCKYSRGVVGPTRADDEALNLTRFFGGNDPRGLDVADGSAALFPYMLIVEDAFFGEDEWLTLLLFAI